MDLAYVFLISPNLGYADMLLFVLKGRQMTEMLEACMKVGRLILLITCLPRLSPELRGKQVYSSIIHMPASSSPPVWMARIMKNKNVFVAWYNYTYFTIHCLEPCMKTIVQFIGISKRPSTIQFCCPYHECVG